MGDGGIGDATFPNKHSEVERRKPIKTLASMFLEGRSSSYQLFGGKYDHARCQFIDEDPVHGPVLAAKDKAQLSAIFGFQCGAYAGLLTVPMTIHQTGCFPSRLVLLGYVGPAAIVGAFLGSKYGRREFQVDTLDTVTAEAKFQEWFVKNETLIPTSNGKFLKWLDKNRLAMAAQAKFRELYRA